MTEPLCVAWLHSDSRSRYVTDREWCLVRNKKEATEDATSVSTRCDYFIILPVGYERRQPTCPECLAVMEKK